MEASEEGVQGYSDVIDAWIDEQKGRKGYVDRSQIKKYLKGIIKG